jgi:hypothetical protein
LFPDSGFETPQVRITCGRVDEPAHLPRQGQLIYARKVAAPR